MKETFCNGPTVTIVVPVYNAEKFIVRCLESLVKQKYKNIEVIVVDDGSTDSTLELADRFIKNDSRIKLIRQKHCGPNLARKKAIRMATGEYIMFVDADDYIGENSIKILMDKFRCNDVDIIRFNALNYGNNEVMVSISDSSLKEQIIDGKCALELLLTTRGNLCTLWGQICKTRIINDIKAFDSAIEYGEDFLANMEIYQKTNKMLVLNEIFYYYNENNPNSTTHKMERDRVIKNVSDRIFVGKKAIENSLKSDFSDAIKNRTIYMQVLAIRDLMIALPKIEKYNKRQFMFDFSKLIVNNIFDVDIESLDRYLRGINFVERIKNRSIVLAILEAKYDYIWRYVRISRIYLKLRHGGVK